MAAGSPSSVRQAYSKYIFSTVFLESHTKSTEDLMTSSRYLKNSKLVNFEKIKDMILSKKDDETVIVRTENKIKRKKIDRGVHLISEPEDKTYSVVFKTKTSKR